MDSNDPAELEWMLNRFKRLMGEIRSGTVRRNQFEPWEIGILLDLEACPLDRNAGELLQCYEKAVERQIEHGSGPPMKLSEYLALRQQKRVVNL